MKPINNVILLMSVDHNNSPMSLWFSPKEHTKPDRFSWYMEHRNQWGVFDPNVPLFF